MEDYIVLTFSKKCDAETASDIVKTLSTCFPDKKIIGVSSVVDLKMYSKEELINLLEFYIDYMKGLINE